MEATPLSGFFFQLEWSALIDRYLFQHPNYENLKALTLTKIASTHKKKRKKKVSFHPYNPSLLREASKQIPILLNKACEDANKYRVSPEGIDAILSSLDFSNELLTYFSHNLPEIPIWIELEAPSQDKIGGVFFYKLDPEYKNWLSIKNLWSINASTIKYIQQDEGKWTLDIINAQGTSITSLKYHPSSNKWEFIYPHVCPLGQCRYVTAIHQSIIKLIEFQPCKECRDASKYCLSWFCTTYKLLISQYKDLRNGEHPSDKTLPLTDALQKTHPASQLQSPQKPIIVTNFFLIERYIKHSHEKITPSIAQSHKYLWMHSAWIMTEALQQAANNIHLYLPAKSIYIELEQPRQIQKQQVAAFSFLENDQHMWTLSVIDNEGHVTWAAFYEKNHWTLPQNYVCPQRQCMMEETSTGARYLLCTSCQERITYYTSWIAIALRMIVGDFQEKIELQEPEEIIETSAYTMQDEKTGEKKEIHTLHRYKIIRYYDACKHKDKELHTKRGSWMSGRPLAESEYEINLDAVIYVQIQPQEYHRTYRHQRYIHAKGKTEHVKPRPRLQPMTIATFRQLKPAQKITQVFASKFDDPQENS